MAWNRPKVNDVFIAKKEHRRSSLLYGWIAGLFVVVVAALVWNFYRTDSSNTSNEKASPKGRGLIREMTPAAASKTPLVEQAQTNSVKAKPLSPQKIGEVRDGKVLLPDGTLHVRHGLKKVKAGLNRRAPTSIFDHATDNEIAALISLKPGDSLIGGPLHHGGKYEEKFLKSLETPIIVTKDDSEEEKTLKRAVIEARKELKEALDRGEDIKKIVEESYKESAKLAAYKDEIRAQVNAMLKEGDYTDDDVKDLVAAANQMLESKGIAPIKLNPITRARLKKLKR